MVITLTARKTSIVYVTHGNTSNQSQALGFVNAGTNVSDTNVRRNVGFPATLLQASLRLRFNNTTLESAFEMRKDGSVIGTVTIPASTSGIFTIENINEAFSETELVSNFLVMNGSISYGTPWIIEIYRVIRS